MRFPPDRFRSFNLLPVTGMLFAVLLALAPVARADEDSQSYQQALKIRTSVAEGDCPGAVNRLKEGVKKLLPDVLVTAGAMFENGVCLKADWDKAVNLYQMAEKEGSKHAKARLASSFAAPGKENALAFFWAAKSLREHPQSEAHIKCIPQNNPDTDLEGINRALEQMSPSAWASCLYVIGVYFDVLAETRYPIEASKYRLSALVRMEFIPATGTIHWTQSEVRVRGFKMEVRDATHEKYDATEYAELTSMLRYGKLKSDAALARFPRPTDINSADRHVLRINFIGTRF